MYLLKQATTRAIYLLLILVISTLSQAQTNYFYGTEGWASTTPGGIGGEVIKVTNLNASGSGSLSEAISKTTPRIIVFEVGGVIDMGGNGIQVRSPYVTIAGQTAPEPGITLINGKFSITTHDVVIQHLRFRPGASDHNVGEWEPDALSTSGAHHVVIDHCSMTWAVDENCTASGSRFNGATPDDWRNNTSHDITISNCIIAEGLSNATHVKGEHSKGTLIHDNATNIAILRNLYASNMQRNPLFKGGARGVIANNVISNPGNAAIHYGLVPDEWEGYEWQTGQMTIIGNYMKYGSSTSTPPLVKAGTGPCEIYMKDNISLNQSGNNVTQYTGDASNIMASPPTWHSNITLSESAKIKSVIADQVGATPWDRDSVDERIVNDMLNNTGSIIDHENEVGGFPNYSKTTSSFNPEKWNMNYLIRKDSNLEITTESEYTHVDSIFTITLDTTGFNQNVMHVDLVVNGLTVERKHNNFLHWENTFKEIGLNEVLYVVTNTIYKPFATETITVEVKGSTTLINSIIEEKQNEFELYYNKHQNEVTVKLFSTQTKNINLEIFNTYGLPIAQIEKPVLADCEALLSWNVSSISAGIYIVGVNSGLKSSYFKIVKN